MADCYYIVRELRRDGRKAHATRVVYGVKRKFQLRKFRSFKAASAYAKKTLGRLVRDVGYDTSVGGTRVVKICDGREKIVKSCRKRSDGSVLCVRGSGGLAGRK